MKNTYLGFRIVTVLFIAISHLILFSSCNQTPAPNPENGDISMVLDSSKSSKIDALLTDYTTYGKFMGSVLVAQEGKVILKKGYGMANLEWDIPNEPNTKFKLASITKLFTAMLILQLVAENKLDLHTPISTYLPDYPKENADRITIHHLLTHTSGTPEFDVFLNYYDIERKTLKPEQLLKLFWDQPLEFEPGSTYSYSNPGYVVLGVIIEKITGESYESVLQEKIFTPLGMTNSGYDHHYTILKNRAAGYTPSYKRGKYGNVNYVDMSIPYAAGSIYSTVEDLYLWDQALYTEKLVSKKYSDLLFGKHITANRNRSYGYGWFMGGLRMGKSKEYVSTMSHGGGINGFRTNIIRIPKTKSFIVLLSNCERSELYDLKVAINGIIHGKPFNPRKSVAYETLEVIEDEGISKGLSFYDKVKNDSDYYLNIEELNIAGYELLQANEIKDAAIVFELNVQAHPDHFGVYDSYGEVLLMQGDTVGAIENYKKSVQLNPNNRGGVAVLKSLGVE